MTSSVDSIRPDSGARAGARTPTGTTQAPTSIDASELSPPGSQTRQQTAASMGNIGTTLADRRAQPADTAPEPIIASWKSKRAQEDYQRAMEFVVDKDFNLDEFGDPFDQRDLTESLFSISK
ncbi:hypothetical protein N7457_007233 [Penicillium paradoxum]|uniref:uncharacterized protein n=1 Tax=Penicillium paradoxum TaxID=176176 RepID=UPI002546D275|nr:uncharacterized protein N7457_007233 [Penicillium paradoxum]KAJ5779513.1 hypothetical protein N7457_007233 [Penicillium paradoxum]